MKKIALLLLFALFSGRFSMASAQEIATFFEYPPVYDEITYEVAQPRYVQYHLSSQSSSESTSYNIMLMARVLKKDEGRIFKFLELRVVSPYLKYTNSVKLYTLTLSGLKEFVLDRNRIGKKREGPFSQIFCDVNEAAKNLLSCNEVIIELEDIDGVVYKNKLPNEFIKEMHRLNETLKQTNGRYIENYF